MTFGVFDFPAPLLSWLDGLLTRVFPIPLTIVLWALLGAIVCMELYRISSPQQRLEVVKQRVTTLQWQLNRYDGEFDGAWPLISELLGQSFKRVALVLPATLLSAYPAIALLLWLDQAHGERSDLWYIFLPAMLIAALAYKVMRKIH
jgi:hypothetical protein